jgi:hypothetical protein
MRKSIRVSLLVCLCGLSAVACGDDTAKKLEDCLGVNCEGTTPGRDIGLDLPTDDRGAVIVPPAPMGDAGPQDTDALRFVDGSLPPDAFKPEGTCPTRDDGVCDEPSAGGECPAGSDPEDCRGGSGPECTEAAECPQGEFCREGQCVPVESGRCTMDTDCGAAEYCDVVTGMCNPDAAPGDCERSADCAPGEVCNLGTHQCMPGGGGGDACVVDADCGLQDVCDNGVCVPGGGGGGGDVAHACDGPATCPEGICVSEAESGGQFPGGICFLECQDDSDCGGGLCALVDPNFGVFACIATCRGPADCRSDWVCYPDPAAPAPYCIPDCNATGCSDGSACDPQSGLCGGGGGGGECPFTNDGECDEPILCPPGTDVADCAGGGGCIGDFDCGIGEFCDFGVCVPDGGGGQCLGDFDCGLGEICDRGLCIPDAGGGCVGDFQCAAGEVCQAGACVADPNGDGSVGSRCGPRSFCDAGLACVGTADGNGTCRERCNANAAQSGCARTEICVPTEQCDPQFAQCDGFCFPDDDCAPDTARQDCGIEAYCDILGRASACTPAGAGAVGDACSAPGVVGCQAGLACLYGTCVAPCDAQGACAAGADCVDLSADFGAQIQVCLDTCDPYDARSCGALVACELMDVLQTGAIGVCRPGVQAGRGAPGDDCRADDRTYWGDCTAANLCGYPDPESQFGQTVCLAMCDAAHADACTGGSTCVEGIVPLEGLGLCLGECDPTAVVSGCPEGNCRPWGVGPLGAGEALAGQCTRRAGRLPRYETCNSFFDASSECVEGTVCAEEERFTDRCLTPCDGTMAHPCPAGSQCRAGAFETLQGNGTSGVWGVCVRDEPGPRCPLPAGDPVPVEICNGVDDDCDGQSDNGPAGDRQLDCPANQECFGGQCF